MYGKATSIPQAKKNRVDIEFPLINAKNILSNLL